MSIRRHTSPVFDIAPKQYAAGQLMTTFTLESFFYNQGVGGYLRGITVCLQGFHDDFRFGLRMRLFHEDVRRVEEGSLEYKEYAQQAYEMDIPSQSFSLGDGAAIASLPINGAVFPDVSLDLYGRMYALENCIVQETIEGHVRVLSDISTPS